MRHAMLSQNSAPYVSQFIFKKISAENLMNILFSSTAKTIYLQHIL